MKNLIKFLFALLLFLGCKNNTLQSPGDFGDYYSSKVIDELYVELDFKSKQIRSLHDIKAEFRLKNISDEEVVFGFSSSCQSAYKIKRYQNEFLDTTENLVCAAVITSIILEPGETKTFPISFESREDRYIKKGSYTLKAFLLENHGIEISAAFRVQ